MAGMEVEAGVEAAVEVAPSPLRCPAFCEGAVAAIWRAALYIVVAPPALAWAVASIPHFIAWAVAALPLSPFLMWLECCDPCRRSGFLCCCLRCLGLGKFDCCSKNERNLCAPKSVTEVYLCTVLAGWAVVHMPLAFAATVLGLDRN